MYPRSSLWINLFKLSKKGRTPFFIGRGPEAGPDLRITGDTFKKTPGQGFDVQPGTAGHDRNDAAVT